MIRAALPFTSLCLLVAFVGGYPLQATVLLVPILFGQLSLGEILRQKVFRQSSRLLAIDLPLNLVLGATCSVLFDQTIRSILGPSRWVDAAYWLMSTTSMVVCSRIREDGRQQFLPLGHWLAIAAAACLTLTHQLHWPLGVAVAIGAVVATSRISKLVLGNGKVRQTLNAVTGTLVVFILWTYRGSLPVHRPLADDEFFRGVSEAFGTWGFTSNPWAYGEPLQYHWGVYAWLGHLAQYSSVSAQQVMQTSGPVIIATTFCLIVFGLMKTLGASDQKALVATIIASTTDTYRLISNGWGFHSGWVESYSQFASLAVLGLVVVLLLTRSPASPTRFGLMFAVLLFVLGLLKTSTLFVFMGGFSVALGVNSVRRRGSRLPDAALWVSGLMSSMIAYRLFSPRITDLDTTQRLTRPSWPIDLNGDLLRWYGDSVAKWLIICLLILVTVCAPVAAVYLIRQRQTTPVWSAMSWWVAGSTLAGLFLTVIGPQNLSSFYGLHAIVSLVVPSMILAALTSQNYRLLNIGIGCGTALTFFIKSIRLSSLSPDIELWWKVVQPAAPTLSAVLLLLVALVSRHRLQLTSLAGWMLVGCLVGFGVSNNLNQRDGDFRNWRSNSESQLDSTSDVLLVWLTDKTPKDAIIAQASADVDVKQLRRRVSADGPGFPFRGRVEIMNAQRLAPTDPSCTAISYLAERGVDYFLATESELELGVLERCTELEFRGEGIAIFKLRVVNQQ